MIVGHPLAGAHRAGTDVNGVVNILSNSKVTKKMMSENSAIPLTTWMKHSNRSKERLDWEAKMKAEIQEEGAGEVVTPTIVVTGGTDEDSDDGGDIDNSDSEEYTPEMIVGHTGTNRSRKYTVQWEGCAATDTSPEPAKRFGTELPLELLEQYLRNNPLARRGHPGHGALPKELASKVK